MGAESSEDLDGRVLRQLHWCSRLLDANQHMTDNWEELGGRRIVPGADYLLLALHTRSTRTFDAGVELLGRQGYGEQVQMLARPLWEDMVDAHWVSLNPELALERFRDHELWERVVRVRIAERYPERFADGIPDEPELTDEQRKHMRKLFNRFGTGSWTGLSMPERVEAIKLCWPNEADHRSLEYLYTWMVRDLNQTVHPSWQSILRGNDFPTGPDQPLVFSFGASPELLPDGVFLSFVSFWQTMRLVMERFGLRGISGIHDGLVVPAMAEFEAVATSQVSVTETEPPG